MTHSSPERASHHCSEGDTADREAGSYSVSSAAFSEFLMRSKAFHFNKDRGLGGISLQQQPGLTLQAPQGWMRSAEVIRVPEWAQAVLTPPQTHGSVVPEWTLLSESRSPRDAATPTVPPLSTFQAVLPVHSHHCPLPWLLKSKGTSAREHLPSPSYWECVTVILSKHLHSSETACWQKHIRGQEHCSK